MCWSYLFSQQFLPFLQAQGCLIHFWWGTWWSGLPWRCWFSFWCWFSLWCGFPLWCWLLLRGRLSGWRANLSRWLFLNRRHYLGWGWRFEAICRHRSGASRRQRSGWTRRLASRLGERVFPCSRGLGIDHSLVYPGRRGVDGDLTLRLEARSSILTGPTSFLNIRGFYSSRFLQLPQRCS